jgi:fatty acid metabolism transcriptional regulator FadR
MSQSDIAVLEQMFEPAPADRASQRVADAIGKTILSGRLRPGQLLPPERAMARRFGVTRNTVREGLRILEQARLVAIRHGSGVRVLDYLTHAGLELLGSLLSAQAKDLALLRDVLEARAVIGRAILHQAIDRLDLEALPAIERAILAFCEAAHRPRADARALQQLDFAVHNQLIRAGGNRAVLLLHNSLREIYQRVAHLFAPLMDDPRALARHYRDLLDALRHDDRDRAKGAIDAIFAAGATAMEG